MEAFEPCLCNLAQHQFYKRARAKSHIMSITREAQSVYSGDAPTYFVENERDAFPLLSACALPPLPTGCDTSRIACVKCASFVLVAADVDSDGVGKRPLDGRRD